MGINGSEFRRKEAITNFLPWWTGQYGYTRYSSPVTIGAVQVGTRWDDRRHKQGCL